MDEGARHASTLVWLKQNAAWVTVAVGLGSTLSHGLVTAADKLTDAQHSLTTLLEYHQQTLGNFSDVALHLQAIEKRQDEQREQSAVGRRLRDQDISALSQRIAVLEEQAKILLDRKQDASQPVKRSRPPAP